MIRRKNWHNWYYYHQ